MKAKDTDRRKLRLNAAAKQRKRRAEQAKEKARRKRAQSQSARRDPQKMFASEAMSATQAPNHNGRRERERGFGDFLFEKEFEVDETEMSAGEEAVSGLKPANRYERRKRRRQRCFGDFLVDKDLDSTTANDHVGDTPEDGSETIPFDLADLRRLLIEAPLEKAQEFAGKSLRIKLVTSGSRFVGMLQNHLLAVYAVGLLILEATDTRRMALLRELGCSEEAKNIFLALLNMTLPPPDLSETDERVRKLAQNRNSEYGLCLWGAKLKNVAPDRFIEEMHIVGGIQAMADVAREEKKRWQLRSDVTDQLGMFGGTGTEDDERQDDDDCVTVNTRWLPKPFKPTKKVNKWMTFSEVEPSTSRDRLDLLEQADDYKYSTWCFDANSRHSKRLSRQNGPFLLYCTRRGDDEHLKLGDVRCLPVTLEPDPEEILDIVIRILLREKD